MLDPVDPVPFVITTIYPVHFTVAVPGIGLVVSLVHVAGRPSINSIAPLLVVRVGSLIVVAVPDSSLPHPLPVSQSINEFTLEKTPIVPVILSVA